MRPSLTTSNKQTTTISRANSNQVDTTSRPHYRRIYVDIEARIASGDLIYGAQLPVLPELCAQYGVSEAPVRRALDELARAGLIVRQRGRGKGTFVNKRIKPYETVIRVLLLGLDLQHAAIEACHEAFGLLEGIRTAAAAHDCPVHSVTAGAINSLASPAPGTRVGYLVISMTANGYQQGVHIATAQDDAACVLVNAPEPLKDQCTIRVDMERGAFLGTDHLAQLGHKRIAYVGGTEGPWFAPRFAGYCRALAAHAIPLDRELVRPTQGFVAEEDARALDGLLSVSDPPTAIFACSDYRAIHLLEHAQNRLGLSVPGDLALCGYDNIGACETVSPKLTTIHHPLVEQGEAAVTSLLALMNGDSLPPEQCDQVLSPKLVIRDSCGARLSPSL